MKKKLADTKVKVKLSDDMPKEVEGQLKEIKENPTQLRETITTALKEMIEQQSLGDHDSEDHITDQETAELVDFIIESLNNLSIKKAGKNDFSLYLMGLTMNQYLQGPTAYARF